MTARSANGSCTPTEFSSGGSANATGVIVAPVMRMLPVVIVRPPAVAAASARRPDRVGQRRHAGGEDARQFLPVLGQHRGKRRARVAGRVAGELDTGFDKRDGVSGALLPQAGERMVEGAVQGGDHR